jgi:prevent-host-death family protein
MTNNTRPGEGDSARCNGGLPEAMQRAADALQFSADEVRRHFARLLSAVEHRGEHVTITRYGKPAAVIVPAEWHEQAKAALEQETEAP